MKESLKLRHSSGLNADKHHCFPLRNFLRNAHKRRFYFLAVPRIPYFSLVFQRWYIERMQELFTIRRSPHRETNLAVFPFRDWNGSSSVFFAPVCICNGCPTRKLSPQTRRIFCPTAGRMFAASIHIYTIHDSKIALDASARIFSRTRGTSQ